MQIFEKMENYGIRNTLKRLSFLILHIRIITVVDKIDISHENTTDIQTETSSCYCH